MRTISAVLFLSLFSFAAFADDVLYSCNMSFHGSGKSVYIGVGFSEIRGEGVISCYHFRTGITQNIPILMRARGPGLGLGVTGLVLSGGATGIGLSSGPSKLLGHYLILRANAAALEGAGVGAGLHLSNGAATIDVSANAESGLGAGVDLMWVDLSFDPSRQIESRLPLSVSPDRERGPEQQFTRNQNVETIYVSENQPVNLVDSQGRVLKTISLRSRNP